MKKASSGSKFKPIYCVIACLLLVVVILAIVLAVTLSGDDSPNETSADTTTDTTPSANDFVITPTGNIEVETDSNGRDITLYVPEGTKTLDLASMVTAEEDWSVAGSDSKILTISQSREDFTIYYGATKIMYHIRVVYRQTLTVSFEGLDTRLSVKEGAKVSSPTQQPSKAGYTFSGWDFDFETLITTSITIFAKWTPNTYKITYQADGGELDVTSSDVVFGTSVELPVPKKNGSIFMGWYNGETLVSSGEWDIPQNVTLVAAWDTHEYRITYNANGGKMDTLYQGVSYGDTITLPTPKRAGYTFVGWMDEGKRIGTSSYQYNKTTNSEFVAEWLENSYTVQYETNGGEELPDGNGLFSEIIQAVPTRSGYTFGGWFYNADLRESEDLQAKDGVVTVYAWWTEESKAECFAYSSGKNGITITGYQSDASSCVIPAYIGGQPVVAIGESAFADCTYLTRIDFSPLLTTIGANAFTGCTKLDRINPSESAKTNLSGVVSIGADAFSKCAFDSFVFPQGVTHLSNNLFTDCTKLVTVEFGGIRSAGKGVFKGCTSLVSLTLPDAIISLGDEFFYGCTSLTDLVLPASLRTLGIGVFADCVSLKKVAIPTSVNEIGERLFEGCTQLEAVENLSANTNIKVIGTRTFADCTKLSDVGIPASVTTIGASAFENCAALETLTLPSFVTVIEEKTFFACNNLKELNALGKIKSIGDRAFYGCHRLSNLTLTGTRISVGEAAFMDCIALPEAGFMQDIASLGKEAFYNCIKLKQATIPSLITVIPEGAFEGCQNLEKLTWHNGITTIETRAFYNCKSLVLDFTPLSIDRIEEEAFYGCYSIASLNFEATLSHIASQAFANCISLNEINFKGSSELWKAVVASDAFDEGADLGNKLLVGVSVDDLTPYLVKDSATDTLWSIDRTLDMNEQKPAAVIKFAPDCIFYNNLITENEEGVKEINDGYTWKLVLQGSTAGMNFQMVVEVKQFALNDLGGHGSVMMDLGSTFASLTDLQSCTATLEIYSASKPNTLLYQAQLGEGSL